jgi:hypothetical protein
MRLPPANSGQRSRGSAVLVMIVLLALMLVFVLANLKTLHFMGRELKLIEKRQLLHWSATNSSESALSSRTNAVAPTRSRPNGSQTREQ